MKKILLITISIIFIASIALAQDKCVTKDNYFASVSEAAIKKIGKYISQNDKVAGQAMLDSKLVFILKGNVPVYLMKTKLFSGLIKIRPVGHTIEVWTFIDAIECK